MRGCLAAAAACVCTQLPSALPHTPILPCAPPPARQAAGACHYLLQALQHRRLAMRRICGGLWQQVRICEQRLPCCAVCVSAHRVTPAMRQRCTLCDARCLRQHRLRPLQCNPSGVVTLFRVVRQPAPAPADGAAAPRHAPAPAASPAGGSGAGSDGDADADAGPLEWQLLHEATLLCVVRETMVNAVRFGLFSGRMRLLVAHQVGRLGG